MQSYTVYDADSGDELEGVPTPELVEASSEAPCGAVLAYREGAVWHYVPDSEEEFYRRVRGEDVVTVYVMED